MGWFNIFGKESNTTTSSTSNYNDSRTFTENTSTNTSNNTSLNTSTNTTTDINNTSTQDRRLVNDRGVGVSADNSTVSTNDSNNTNNWTQDASWSVSDSHNFAQSNDSHNILNSVSDFGAVQGGLGIAAAALGNNSGVFNTAAGVVTKAISSNENAFLHQLDAGNFLASTGMDMLKANIDYARHLSDSNQILEQNAITQIKDASSNAISQVAAIAAKPLNANDPQHIIVIVGLVVVGALALRGFK